MDICLAIAYIIHGTYIRYINYFCLSPVYVLYSTYKLCIP